MFYDIGLPLIVCGIPIIMLIAICVVSSYSIKEKYNVEVFAEIIDYEEYATDAYGRQYVAVFKYKYNDEEYIMKYMLYRME